MEKNDQNLKWRLCKAYFLILTSSSKADVSLDELCNLSKVSNNEARKIIPKNYVNYNFFFLKILLAKLDQETLCQLKNDISEDTISTVHDKILEGITIRFEKYLPYRQALKILSISLNLKAENFLKLLEKNYSFMLNLIDLVEDRQNCSIKSIKSIALNIAFCKAMDIFLKEESDSLDVTVRHLDKYLSDSEDIGILVGIIKNKL